ncbi:MAG: 16S rRNA (cytosine(1402)-N(4))-methyltransferase RsmH [Candidatus Eisenbacteria bacterium]
MQEHEKWHLPVMVNEVREYLITDATKVIVDCTVGTGGHAETLLKASPDDCILIGIDLDGDALAIASERLSHFGERVVLKQMNFRDLKSGLPSSLHGKVDALLIDCGISRLQIVTSERGFSFDTDAPLDMRFDASRGKTAARVLDEIGFVELRGLIVRFGEGARAGRIARAIIRMRDAGQLKTTGDLAGAIKSVVRNRAAKSLARVFLAVRSYLTGELESLAEALDVLPGLLSAGGRACVISYHSLEDRIVKTSFKKYAGKCVCPPGRIVCDCGRAPLFKILTPKPIPPTAGEIRSNSSARSAKIRVVERCDNG